MRVRQVVALCLVALVACNHVPAKQAHHDPDTIRYRLLLRENPVSSSDAAHCFVSCQSTRTPQAYVECLSACPGFEKTPGEYCSSDEVPPVAACLTVRRVKIKNEPPAGLIVLAVIGEIALVVGAASLCNVSTQCGINQFPPPK